MTDTVKLIEAYYAAFNAGDAAAFLALLTDDVAHDINQGPRETGRDAFRKFVDRMTHAYAEQITDLVIMTDATGTRAAAEFTVHGTYLQNEEGLPPAHGQTYILPAGAFFTVRDGKVARIANFYNLPDWIAQVS